MIKGIRVVKFGGASVCDAEGIWNTAKRLASLYEESRKLVVVVSAMAGETDRLNDLGRRMNSCSEAETLRELDALVATGENVSAALLTLALQKIGIPAQSFSAHQLRIHTDGRFQRARIRKVDSGSLLQALNQRKICVAAGFQGIDDSGNLVTLGRGGSDTSAVAIAIAVGAERCEFFKDVDGIHTADPRYVQTPHRLERLAYEELLELTSSGAKVLQMRSVELAMKHQLSLVIRPNFSEGEGTLIEPLHEDLEGPLVSGLAHHKGQAKISIRGLPDWGSSMTAVLGPLADDDISIDFITQNIDSGNLLNLSFTLEETLLEQAKASLIKGLARFDKAKVKVSVERGLAKVTAVGIGMRTHSGVAHRVFKSLADHDIEIVMALSTEIKVSCLVPESKCEKALQAIHREFFESCGVPNSKR